MTPKNPHRTSEPSRPSPDNPLWASLTEKTAAFLRRIIQDEGFTVQEQHQLLEMAVDFHLWQEPELPGIWEASGLENHRGKDRRRALLNRIRRRWTQLQKTPTDYSTFTPPQNPQGPGEILAARTGKTILGRCPVAGEKTRCCNLLTLDAVEQCGFGCSYCSIQSFYGGGRIYFHANLPQKLDALTADLHSQLQEEPGKLFHIGTGQSSDSLLWGNRQDLLTHLCTFARKNPRVILELKTKSARITPLLNQAPPGGTLPTNLIATWSLNPQPIIDAEEHGTASLVDRLTAARRAADRGLAVGFHLHPIILSQGWKEDYADLIREIQRRFTPEETVMISLGTLTFIKPVLRQIRRNGLETRVHQIPLTDAAGKLSYPLETKKELFSHAYQSFSGAWKNEVFFYLCMEDISLWQPVLGRTYPDNAHFEEDMKQNYFRKLLRRGHAAD